MQSNKGFIGLGLLIAIVLGLIVVGGGAYYIGHQNAAPSVQPNYPDISTTQQTQQQTSDTSVQATTNTSATTPTPAPKPTPAPIVQNSSNGTIDQDGKTLSLNSTTQLTGTIPSNFATAQIYAVPSPWTGTTDHAGLYQLTRGYSDYNKNVLFSGTKVDANGHYSIPLSYVVQDTPYKNYTLFLFGIPANDPVGQYHDSDFVIPPTLLATGHITVSGGEVPACTSQASAFIPSSTLDSVAKSKSLLSIDGFACNVSTLTVVVSTNGTEVLRQTVSVSHNTWEAGKEMALANGSYTVQVYGTNGNLLATNNFVVQPNGATLDSSSLTQSLAATTEPYITGTASVQVIICLTASSYSGATDYDTLSSIDRSSKAGMGVPDNVECSPNVAPSTDAPKFRVPIRTGGANVYGGLWAGTYRLFLFEGTSLHTLLTTSTFTLTQ